MGAVEEMGGHWRGYDRAFDSCNWGYAKCERDCQDQREILHDLGDLKAGKRRMYELEDRKDQLMAVLKLALVNLAIRARDNYFPPNYACATWQRLAPFFRLPGRVAPGGETFTVVLHGFNDRQLKWDLATMSTLLARVQLRLPDGRSLVLSASAPARSRTTMRERRVT